MKAEDRRESERSLVGLSHVRLFAGLSTEDLSQIAQTCTWRRHTSGAHILSREAPDVDVHFVIAGRVRITAFSAAGRQVTYGEMGPGEWFGDFAAIDGRVRSADVIAVSETLVAAMGSAYFRQLLREHPSVCDCMLKRLVSSVRELTERVFEFSTLGVQNRLHAELLRLARQAGVANNSACIDPAPKHNDLAGQISTYREQITRELSGMVREGLLQRRGNALIVPDVARLQRLVEEVRRSA